MHPFLALDNIHEEELARETKSGTREMLFRWSPPWLQPSQENHQMVLKIEPTDLAKSARLYTGEPIRTQLAIRRILELETARVLLKTRTQDPMLLAWVKQLHARCLRQCYATRGCVVGECSLAAIAFMRYLAVCPWDPFGQILARQFQRLRHLRDDQGRWLRVPFYYTLLVLVECAPTYPAARDEILHARGSCQQAIDRMRIAQPYRARRESILRAALQFDPDENSNRGR
ncbi:hypothetical protein JW848_04040 [Candidatus Bipolaricaulota bacterium]|nr:hypothetical protein [Candidatus Bipolaricaulota bacterium]